MLAAGIIEPAPTSAWASAATIPAKHAPDGTWSDHRYCLDFSSTVNPHLKPLHTHVPNDDDCFQNLGQSTFFTKLDLHSGYFQLPLHDDSKYLTAFWWGTNLYRFTRAPFGIKTCPAAFQGIMDYELQAAHLTHCTQCSSTTSSYTPTPLKNTCNTLSRYLRCYMGAASKPILRRVCSAPAPLNSLGLMSVNMI